MTELNNQVFFGGDEDVDPDDLGKVEVNNFTIAVDRILQDVFDWDGGAIGAIGLTLSVDNSRVVSGTFITRGNPRLSEYAATCDQIWPEGPANIVLAIKIDSLAIFTFSRGGLWSDLIPAEKVNHFYCDKTAASNAPILGTPAARGIGDFCLRMVCQVSGASSGRKGVVCKYMILLFPTGAEGLSSTPEAQFGGWPGLKVGDGYFPLMPPPATKWQCPVLPFIRPGTPFAANDSAPASYRLRFSIAAVMSKAVQPETARTSASLMAKWEKIRTNPRELAEKTPATVWPTAAPFQEESGKSKLKLSFSLDTVFEHQVP
jgi:hypothetical protein